MTNQPTAAQIAEARARLHLHGNQPATYTDEPDRDDTVWPSEEERRQRAVDAVATERWGPQC